MFRRNIPSIFLFWTNENRHPANLLKSATASRWWYFSDILVWPDNLQDISARWRGADKETP